MPVIAAVHGFCLGGGIGLAGNADIIVASEDATFGLPEVDRGALGAATHLSRLVPQHQARAMMYTSATATAAELHAFGSVLTRSSRGTSCARPRSSWPPRSRPRTPPSSGMAKEAFNGIDPSDVKRSYRYEQGFTFELNLSGVSDRARQSFGRRALTGERMTDNIVMSPADVVGELRSGMTIGIGGWGSRRKPMALVRPSCAPA